MTDVLSHYSVHPVKCGRYASDEGPFIALHFYVYDLLMEDLWKTALVNENVSYFEMLKKKMYKKNCIIY